MDLVSIDFSLVDLFLIGVKIDKKKGLDFIYRFKDEEKKSLQKFIRHLAKSSASNFKPSKTKEISSEQQLNLFWRRVKCQKKQLAAFQPEMRHFILKC